jgi:hypothetical protein
MNTGRQDTGLLNVPTRKRQDKQKRLALRQMQALREPNPSAVTVANQSQGRELLEETPAQSPT